MLHNSFHRYGMPNDWRFVTRIITFSEPHITKFVLIVIDYDEPNKCASNNLNHSPTKPSSPEWFICPSTICKIKAKYEIWGLVENDPSES